LEKPGRGQRSSENHRLAQARELLESLTDEEGNPTYKEMPDGSFVRNN
jgi:hypothetical protein